MNPHKKQRLFCVAIGTLVGMFIALVAVCCMREGEAPVVLPPACVDAGATPVEVPPSTDAGGCAVDAGDASDAAPDVAVDAGTSCGTHPWCRHPKECCARESDCCL
jgi:hypothetical protein